MPPKKRYAEDDDDEDDEEEIKAGKKFKGLKKRGQSKDSQKFSDFIGRLIQYVRYNGMESDISEDDAISFVCFGMTAALEIFKDDLSVLGNSYIELMKINDTNSTLRQEDLLFPVHKIIKQNIFRERDCENKEQLEYGYIFYLFVNFAQIKILARQLTVNFKNIEVVPESNMVYVSDCVFESEELLHQNIVKILILSLMHLLAHFNGFSKKYSQKIGDESNAKCSKFYNWFE